jgi:hypothetical protein
MHGAMTPRPYVLMARSHVTRNRDRFARGHLNATASSSRTPWVGDQAVTHAVTPLRPLHSKSGHLVFSWYSKGCLLFM